MTSLRRHVTEKGFVLDWALFRAECPEGARCGLCGDKIKNEPARKVVSGSLYPHYVHPERKYCETCNLGEMDCSCR